jgi:hypothetical protein
MTEPCKEPGCESTVTYVRIVVEGARLENTSATKVVYLTCSKGHVHAYDVPA